MLKGGQKTASEVIAEFSKLGVTASLAAKVGVEGLGASFVQLGKAIGGLFTSKVFLIIAAVAAAIGVAAFAIDKLYTSHAEYQEILKENQTELRNIISELESLESELEETQKRIKELQQLNQAGTISPVEEEELRLLKLHNDELER